MGFGSGFTGFRPVYSAHNKGLGYCVARLGTFFPPFALAQASTGQHLRTCWIISMVILGMPKRAQWLKMLSLSYVQTDQTHECFASAASNVCWW